MPKKPCERTVMGVNMLKAPKHCLNLLRRIFVKCFDDSEIKSARKILSY